MSDLADLRQEYAQAELDRTHVADDPIDQFRDWFDIGESEITTAGTIVDSLIGRNATVANAEGLLPEGQRLVVGENSTVKL